MVSLGEGFFGGLLGHTVPSSWEYGPALSHRVTQAEETLQTASSCVIATHLEEKITLASWEICRMLREQPAHRGQWVQVLQPPPPAALQELLASR